jgi:hypothetical protein
MRIVKNLVNARREDWGAWLHDRKADLTGRKVYYGPNHSKSPWIELGPFAWGCNACEGAAGGYEPTYAAVRHAAEAHALIHPGVRAYFDVG